MKSVMILIATPVSTGSIYQQAQCIGIGRTAVEFPNLEISLTRVALCPLGQTLFKIPRCLDGNALQDKCQHAGDREQDQKHYNIAH